MASTRQTFSSFLFQKPLFQFCCSVKSLTDSLLLDSLKSYISLEERGVIEKALSDFTDEDEDLMDFLSSFKCYKLPNKDNIKRIILELAHQEIVQNQGTLLIALNQL